MDVSKHTSRVWHTGKISVRSEPEKWRIPSIPRIAVLVSVLFAYIYVGELGWRCTANEYNLAATIQLRVPINIYPWFSCKSNLVCDVSHGMKRSYPFRNTIV